MNELIISKLKDLAKLRQVQGASSFRSAAYSNAAYKISNMGVEITDVEQLSSVEGIGPKIVSVVDLVLKTGTHPELEQYDSMVEYVRQLTRVPGIGPKSAMRYIAQGIKSLEDLKKYAYSGNARRPVKLLEAIAYAEIDTTGRIPRQFIESVAEHSLKILRQLPEVESADITGSYRRKKSTVKDLDILVASTDPAPVVGRFLSMGTLIESGDKKASIYSFFNRQGMEPRRFRIDLMIVPPKSYGAALCHFTGSKEHNVRLRGIAKSRGITVSQNGVYAADGSWLGGENEGDLYNVLGLEYVEPEDRDG